MFLSFTGCWVRIKANFTDVHRRALAKQSKSGPVEYVFVELCTLIST